MSLSLTYRFFTDSIIYLMLIGQLMGNVGSYCYWFMDSEIDVIELSQSENSDSLEDSKEEKDNKLRVYLTLSFVDESVIAKAFSSPIFFKSLLLSDVTTPPPEQSIYIS